MAFSQIQGQDRPIAILKGYLATKKFAGAYLFVGPQGTGKYLAAVNFAKAVNCLGDGLDACDTCISCLKIEKNQHPDFHLIEAGDISEAIKIEAIRELKREISLKPYEGKRKVFIIDDAHKLTPEAANALLKVLEERAGESLIILVTAKPALLFKTIISRCQSIRFLPLKRPELEGILKDDYALNSSLAHFLAYAYEGRIGSALRLKDSEILREKNRIIDAFILARKVDNDTFLPQDRAQFRQCLETLTSWFRDIYLIKVGVAHSELINLDRRDELLRTMQRYSWFELEETMKFIADASLYLEQNVNLKLLLSNLKVELWKTKSW